MKTVNSNELKRGDQFKYIRNQGPEGVFTVENDLQTHIVLTNGENLSKGINVIKITKNDYSGKNTNSKEFLKKVIKAFEENSNIEKLTSNLLAMKKDYKLAAAIEKFLDSVTEFYMDIDNSSSKNFRNNLPDEQKSKWDDMVNNLFASI